MSEHTMEYNSSTDKLIMPEYGRNIQNLIVHAKTIENLEVRQLFIEKVVELMIQMTPYSRNMDDHRQRLWRHVFQIAKYDLGGVVMPNGEPALPENTEVQPKKVKYPKSKARFRHYGSNVQDLIDKALAMEEGPVREGFVRVIGAYMKLAYKTWNKDHFVSDDVVKADLATLSEGRLIIPENEPLASYWDNRQRKNNGGKSYGKHGKSNHHRRKKK